MAGTTLSEAIDRYHGFRAGNQMAANTLRVDRRNLSHFLAHTGNVQMWHLGSKHGTSYRAALTERQYSANTVRSHLDTLRGFIGWSHEMRLLPPTSNPLFGIKSPKVPKQKRQRVPETDFHELLDAAHLMDEQGRTVHGSAHDRIIVAIGLFTLCRQSEMLTMKVEDLDLPAGFLDVVLHKTGEVDTMPVSGDFEVELRRWLRWYANDTMTEHGPMKGSWLLVGSRRPPKLVPDPAHPGRGKVADRPQGNSNPFKPFEGPEHAVQRALARYGMPLRGEDGKSLREGMHTLRRSGARAMYDGLVGEGYDGALREVQAWLHHANAAMTERYIGIDLDVKKRNDRVRGKVMYPRSRPTNNVVPLRAVENN